MKAPVKLTEKQERLLSDLRAAGILDKLEYLSLKVGDNPKAPSFNGADPLAIWQGNGPLTTVYPDGTTYVGYKGTLGDGKPFAVDHPKALTLSSNPPDVSEAPSTPASE